MSDYLVLTFLAVLGLAIVHIFVRRIHFLDVLPRSRWLSFAGGVSVAYVFVHIFPELNEQQEALKENIPEVLQFAEHHVYLLALIGFSFFYALERLVKSRGSHKPSAENKEQPSEGIFWIHMGSFAVYNALIGYLLVHREETGLKSLFFFFFAMLLHFVVNDFGLRQHHHAMYDHTGRWILSAAVIIGWALGVLATIEQNLITALFAFLAGGVVLNVMKEELPEDRKSSSMAFITGVTIYTVLLLTI